MANKLLQRGAYINYCNRDGKTALVICVKMGIEKAVRFLLSKGADQHIEDLTGKDACDYSKNTKFDSIPDFNNC